MHLPSSSSSLSMRNFQRPLVSMGCDFLLLPLRILNLLYTLWPVPLGSLRELFTFWHMLIPEKNVNIFNNSSNNVSIGCKIKICVISLKAHNSLMWCLYRWGNLYLEKVTEVSKDTQLCIIRIQTFLPSEATPTNSRCSFQPNIKDLSNCSTLLEIQVTVLYAVGNEHSLNQNHCSYCYSERWIRWVLLLVNTHEPVTYITQ